MTDGRSVLRKARYIPHYILENRFLMNVLLLMIALLCATGNNISLHVLSNKKVKCDPFLFNGAILAIWIIILFVYNLGWHGATGYTFIYGVAYGITLAGFTFFKTMAMASGPISLTALIGCSSFVVTTIFNAVYWKEEIGLFEISGIALMIVAILLINLKPNEKNENVARTSLKWKIYSILFFILSAVVGIIFRLHQSVDAVNTNEMMIISSCVAAVALFVVFLIRFGIKRKKEMSLVETGEAADRKQIKSIAIIAILCGVLSCVYNRLNIYNSGVLPSIIFFPIFNGGLVITSFVAGEVVFKEKASKLQVAGVIIGILAILVISRFFGAF